MLNNVTVEGQVPWYTRTQKCGREATFPTSPRISVTTFTHLCASHTKYKCFLLHNSYFRCLKDYVLEKATLVYMLLYNFKMKSASVKQLGRETSHSMFWAFLMSRKEILIENDMEGLLQGRKYLIRNHNSQQQPYWQRTWQHSSEAVLMIKPHILTTELGLCFVT